MLTSNNIHLGQRGGDYMTRKDHMRFVTLNYSTRIIYALMLVILMLLCS